MTLSGSEKMAVGAGAELSEVTKTTVGSIWSPPVRSPLAAYGQSFWT
jgi:hypothetical protein